MVFSTCFDLAGHLQIFLWLNEVIAVHTCKTEPMRYLRLPRSR